MPEPLFLQSREGANPGSPLAWRPGGRVGRGVLSVSGATLACVDVTDADIAGIPVGNLRVSRAQFRAVWAAAERRDYEQGERGVPAPRRTRRPRPPSADPARAPCPAVARRSWVAMHDALSAYPGLGVTAPPPSNLRDIARMTTEVHLRYQSADYGAATRILPALIKSVDGLLAQSRGDERRRALELQSSVYVAAAKLVTKVGNGELAWLTADRAATAALHADSPTLGAAAAYQVACAFLKNDHLDDAENVALVTAANLDDDSPAGLSVRGALTLIAAVIAGRAASPISSDSAPHRCSSSTNA